MGSYSKETISEALKDFLNIDKNFNQDSWNRAVDTLTEIICDNASSGDGYSYVANVSQTGNTAPFVVTQITNTFPTTPIYTYKSVGNYRITFREDNWLNTYGYFNSGFCISSGSSAIIGSFAMAADSASSILLFTYNNSSVSANNILNNTQLKIGQGRVWSIINTLEVKDAFGNVNPMFFGRQMNATDGLDVNLGENELPPYPPSGAYDCRFLPVTSVPIHNGSYNDYRNIQTSNPTSEYKFRFQFGNTNPLGAGASKSGTDPAFPNSNVNEQSVNIRLTLDPLVRSIRIQDVITGSFFDKTLTASGTANLSGNILGFNKYKLTVTYF